LLDIFNSGMFSLVFTDFPYLLFFSITHSCYKTRSLIFFASYKTCVHIIVSIFS
jgi:hypothetical protein